MADTATVIEDAGTEVAVQEEQSVAPLREPTDLMGALVAAANDPNVDPDKIERLAKIYERIEDRRSEQEYNTAMSQAQAEMPRVMTNAENTQTRSKYAKLDAVDRAMKPIITKHGFGMSFFTEPTERAGFMRIGCKVTHSAGHSETYTDEVPLDTKGPKGNAVKNETHGWGSAGTYYRRKMKMMIFDVAETNDDDGNAAGGQLSGETLSPEQTSFIIDTLKTLGTPEEAFLKWCATKGYSASEIALLPVERFAAVEKQLKFWLSKRDTEASNDQ